MLDISIIIVSWNTKAFVRQCLSRIQESCGELTNEIVVVDNASSDGTPEMVEQEFPEVILVPNQSNLGFAKANNVGMRRTTGKYVCLINSDVTLLPDCLQKMCAYMNRHPDVGMLGPRMLFPDGTPGPSCMRRPSLLIWFMEALGLSAIFESARLHMENFNCASAEEVDVLNGWFWMVRRSALGRVGLLGEQFFMYGEDIEWCHRFQENGWQIVYFPDAAAIHFVGGSAARSPIRFYVEMQRANLKYWKQYHGFPSQVMYVLIVILHQLLRALGYSCIYLLRPADRSEASLKIKRSFACLRWIVGIPAERQATS
jgi:hypothetical protein